MLSTDTKRKVVHCKKSALSAVQRDYMQLRYTENRLRGSKCPLGILKEIKALFIILKCPDLKMSHESSDEKYTPSTNQDK